MQHIRKKTDSHINVGAIYADIRHLNYIQEASSHTHARNGDYKSTIYTGGHYLGKSKPLKLTNHNSMFYTPSVPKYKT